jgi:hypothetical protein
MPNLFLEVRDGSDEPGTSPTPLPEEEALTVLRGAAISGSKLIPWGSNYSFAVALESGDGRSQLAIYKPRAGEAPLYDFPDGTLYLRETASYLLSRWLGWDIVPPTVVRDGPHGVGSVQLYVEPMDEGADDHRFWRGCAPEIERLVLFDHVANNADRKIGHCLRDVGGKVWGIDHGLTFNSAPKLRTVLWQYVGEPISPKLLADLDRMVAGEDLLRRELGGFLDLSELNALFGRTRRLREMERFPSLNPRRNVPYGWW